MLLGALWLATPVGSGAAQAAAAPSSCPAVGGKVTVSVATMQQPTGLQDVIDSCPTGTTFNLPAGTFYGFHTIYPKDNDSITGKGSGTSGTRLYGAVTIPSSNFVKDRSGDWVDSVDVTIDTRTIAENDDPRRKSCAPGYYPQKSPNAGLCSYPDLLYMDGGWLIRTLDSDPAKPCPAPIGVGKYCINYDSKKIFLGTNPSGHTMTFNGVSDGTKGHLLETGITTSGPDDGTIINVTVKDIRVSYYANTNGAGGGIGMGDGWTVTGVEASYNHACGLSIGGTSQSMPKLAQDSVMSWNGQAGFCGLNSYTTFDNNSVTYNNQDFWAVPFGGGGGKFSAGGPITVSNSDFSHNNGNGLGFDVGEQNFTVTGNSFDDNINFGGGGHGLHIEVSCFGTATNNTATGNDRMGIYVLNSHDVTVSGNNVGPNGTAEIQVGTSNRGGSNACGNQNQATNDAIQNNTITMTVDTQSGVMNKTPCKTCVTGSFFANNDYKTSGKCGEELWTWYTGSSEVTVAWSAWHSTYDQDTTGSCV